MSEYNQEYDDYCYDDGWFADSGADEVRVDYDIPTYDELDLEGRYYTYGSREDYNAWRNEQICALREASRPRPTYNRPRKSSKKLIHARHELDELYASDIKTYRELTKKEKAAYGSREAYNKWRNDFITNRRKEREEKEAKKEQLKGLIEGIGYTIFIVVIIIYFLW